ncbi:MAG: four helix bundle protein [Calditrichia bacterium]
MVWEKAHQLTCELYSLTKLSQKEELDDWTSQMRRDGVSITANITEGCGKTNGKPNSRDIGKFPSGQPMNLSITSFLQKI